MKPLAIAVGAAYAKAGDCVVRVVDQVDDDYVLYHDFSFPDGKPIGTGRCSCYAFTRWAYRALEAHEAALLREDLARAKDQDMLHNFINMIPDSMLLKEVQRRGLDVS